MNKKQVIVAIMEDRAKYYKALPDQYSKGAADAFQAAADLMKQMFNLPPN